MAKMVSSIVQGFLNSHPEELGADGKLRVSIGGGAGFIGSHIAKQLKEEVSAAFSFFNLGNIILIFSSVEHLIPRDATLLPRTGRTTSL